MTSKTVLVVGATGETGTIWLLTVEMLICHDVMSSAQNIFSANEHICFFPLLIPGKHVVLQLLKQKQNVRAIVRSKERLINSLDELQPDSSSDLNIVSRLDATEASLLDLTQDELQKVNTFSSAICQYLL